MSGVILIDELDRVWSKMEMTWCQNWSRFWNLFHIVSSFHIEQPPTLFHSINSSCGVLGLAIGIETIRGMYWGVSCRFVMSMKTFQTSSTQFPLWHTLVNHKYSTPYTPHTHAHSLPQMNVESWNTTSRLVNHGQIRLGENPGRHFVLTCHNNTRLPSTLIISTSISPLPILPTPWHNSPRAVQLRQDVSEPKSMIQLAKRKCLSHEDSNLKFV